MVLADVPSQFKVVLEVRVRVLSCLALDTENAQKSVAFVQSKVGHYCGPICLHFGVSTLRIRGNNELTINEVSLPHSLSFWLLESLFPGSAVPCEVVLGQLFDPSHTPSEGTKASLGFWEDQFSGKQLVGSFLGQSTQEVSY